MILYYAAENSRVVESLKTLLSGLQVRQCRSLKELASCLRKPCHGLLIGLLVVSDIDEMLEIVGLHSLIRDLRLVLVLPGRDTKMVVMAHKLAPRFIAYADSGYEQISAVLAKMIHATAKKDIASAISYTGADSQTKGYELKS